MRRVTVHEPSTTGPQTGRPPVLREGDRVWAPVAAGSLETGIEMPAPQPHEAPFVVVRTGSAVTDAETSFASWSPAAWARLEDALTALHHAHPGHAVALWPGAGSVISDAVSALSFSRKHADVPLLADPCAWVTEAMRPDAHDHLTRFAHALTLCESLVGVVVRPVPGVLDLDQCRLLLDAPARRAGVLLTPGDAG